MNILTHPKISFEYAGLFHSEAEWIHPTRTETTYEIICVTRGEVWICEGEREYCMKRGQVLLLSPGVEHKGTRPSRDVGFYWVHFHLKDEDLPFSTRYFDSFEPQSLFKELLHYNNLPCAPEYLVGATLVRILSELCYLSDEHLSRFDERAEKIREWIRIHADAGLTAGRVAEHFGYSPDHLSRICKKNYGEGAGALINRFLMARARELLCNTDQYVKEIAAVLKFSSDKAFIAYFKYHEGCFPGEFRARFSKTHMNSR